MYKIISTGILAVLLLFTVKVHSQDYGADEYFAMAKKEAAKQNFAKGAEYCEKALEITPLDMDIKEYLGKCYMESGQLEKARITLLEVLERSPRRTDSRHFLLNIETQTKRYSSAVCYANELLEITPYSKTLWMRKINLYNLMHNTMEANRATRRLYQIYPEDTEVRALYNNLMKEEALKMNKGGDVVSAVKQYEEALQVSTNDPELYIEVINNYIKLGNYASALATADRGLFYLPNNREIFNKKIAILQSLNRYQEAMDMVNVQLKRGSSAYYEELLVYLTAEAARYYKNSDPYVLYGQLYERDKGNQEAHDFLLSTAIGRGYFADAQELLTQDLRSNPNSKELLSKQLYVYENTQNMQGVRSTIEKLYKLYPQDSDVVEKYDAFTFQDAKIDFSEQNYKGALPVFQRLSQKQEYAKAAGNYIYSIYLAQKMYDRALAQINDLIASYPGEQQFILKKIDLLADMEDFESAYEMARSYRDRYPDNPEYAYMLRDLSIEYIKFLNGQEDYMTIKLIADDLIAADPQNLQAYNYGIGARISMGQFEEAMQLIQTALTHFPDNKELRLKEAGVYSESKKHPEAVAALRKLVADYPYNSSIRGSLIEELYLAGKQKEENQEVAEAMAIYNEVLALRPKDTVAAIKLANIHIAREEYTEAMAIVDKALTFNPDNGDLLYLKGLIYEKQEDFAQARLYQGKYNAPSHKHEQHMEHLDYLDAKMLKNQVNLSFLKATTDSIPFNTSVATLEYIRFSKNNTYIGRVNYAARETGVGVQGELDWYHVFKNKSNFLANVGIANQYFPDYRVAFSFYQPFKKSYQAEIGGRYAGLADGRKLLTGIVGIERTFDRFWLNARALIISDGDNLYNSMFGQARFYMKNEKDYVVAMASAGTAPEDQRLDFQINTFLSYVNTMVGAGYFHYTSNRTSFGIVGNWYNYKLSQEYYMNQYNLYLTVRTKF